MGDDAKADSYGFTTTERGGRRRKPLPHCGCTVPCQRSFTCPICQHVRPWCFGAGDSDECDACWGEQERADAITAARAAGYAEAVADVVAWLLWKVSTLNSHTYGQDDERTVLERVVDGIEVEAARKAVAK